MYKPNETLLRIAKACPEHAKELEDVTNYIDNLRGELQRAREDFVEVGRIVNRGLTRGETREKPGGMDTIRPGYPSLRTDGNLYLLDKDPAQVCRVRHANGTAPFARITKTGPGGVGYTIQFESGEHMHVTDVDDALFRCAHYHR